MRSIHFDDLEKFIDPDIEFGEHIGSDIFQSTHTTPIRAFFYPDDPETFQPRLPPTPTASINSQVKGN
jgi:hypothetical protein